MPKGMLGIGLPPAQARADDGDQRGAHVRKVVDRVRKHGNAARQQTRDHFGDAQQRVERDAYAARQLAIGAPHGGIARFPLGHKAADQKILHTPSPNSAAVSEETARNFTQRNLRAELPLLHSTGGSPFSRLFEFFNSCQARLPRGCAPFRY